MRVWKVEIGSKEALEGFGKRSPEALIKQAILDGSQGALRGLLGLHPHRVNSKLRVEQSFGSTTVELWSPLGLAIRKKQLTCVEALLAEGASVNGDVLGTISDHLV